MEQREDTRADHRENRHGLGRSVNRSSPALLQQTEDGGNQRSSVANTNPENEVNNRPAPVDRICQSPHTDTRADKPKEAHAREGCSHQRNRHADPPPHRGFCLDDAADLFSDPVEITIIRDKGLFVELSWLHFSQQSGLSQRPMNSLEVVVAILIGSQLEISERDALLQSGRNDRDRDHYAQVRHGNRGLHRGRASHRGRHYDYHVHSAHRIERRRMVFCKHPAFQDSDYADEPSKWCEVGHSDIQAPSSCGHLPSSARLQS